MRVQAKAVFHCEVCWLFNACPDLLCIAGHRLFQHLSYFRRAVKQCTFHDMAGHLHDTTRPSHANPAILPRPWLESQRLVSSQTADLEPHGLSSAKSGSCCMSCTRCCGASCFCRGETVPFASVASSSSSSSSSSFFRLPESSLFSLFAFSCSPYKLFTPSLLPLLLFGTPNFVVHPVVEIVVANWASLGHYVPLSHTLLIWPSQDPLFCKGFMVCLTLSRFQAKIHKAGGLSKYRQIFANIY